MSIDIKFEIVKDGKVYGSKHTITDMAASSFLTKELLESSVQNTVDKVLPAFIKDAGL